MPSSFIPLDAINHLLKNWWKITLIAVIFGILGLIFSYFFPPKYEAEAIFYATIDYRDINFENLADETGTPLKFSQYDVDLALSTIQTMLLLTKGEAFAHGRIYDPILDGPTFNKNMRIERQHAEWYLRYRHQDPLVAQEIVNYWAEIGLARIKEAQATERIAPYVMTDLVSKASLPVTPIYQNRKVLVLAGAVIGFALGILVIDFQSRTTGKKEEQEKVECSPQ